MSFNPNDLGDLRSETKALHAGQVPDPTTNARAVPIYATTSYTFDDAAHAARLFGLQEFGNIYTRIMNPTTGVFEERVAALEGGVGALGLASGQAAETLRDPQHRPGRPEHRVAAPASTAAPTTCSTTRCPSWASRSGSSTVATRRTTPRRSTTTPALLYLETIGNPRLDVADISAVADIAHAHGLPLIVDNTCAPLIAQADRARRRHRHPLRHQVDRRPRHGRSAASSWTAASSTGRMPPGSRRTSSIPTRPTTASSYSDGVRAAGVHPQAAGPGPAGPRRGALARSTRGS